MPGFTSQQVRWIVWLCALANLATLVVFAQTQGAAITGKERGAQTGLSRGIDIVQHIVADVQYLARLEAEILERFPGLLEQKGVWFGAAMLVGKKT